MNRREFVRTAGGVTAASTVAASGSATAQSEKPKFRGYLEGIDGGYEDLRGNDEVTVEVGASGNGGSFAFSPAGVWVDEGTTVKWEWTGNGGGHNVVAEDGPAALDSGETISEAGVHYEHTFEEAGVTTYFCQPHKGLGMKGAVAVGDDVATKSVGGEGGGGKQELHDFGVPIQAHWVGASTILMIIISLVFTFYVLKYGESPNTGNTGGRE
ncbi:MAG: halocyanin domain-containing protein [Halolamina sp.]